MQSCFLMYIKIRSGEFVPDLRAVERVLQFTSPVHADREVGLGDADTSKVHTAGPMVGSVPGGSDAESVRPQTRNSLETWTKSWPMSGRPSSLKRFESPLHSRIGTRGQ